jgi:hypothetical protein
MDKRTMKAFDEMCLTPVEELTAAQIRQIRLREKASQAVFARHHRARQPVGARRETSARRLAQAAHAGRQEGTAGRCVTVSGASIWLEPGSRRRLINPLAMSDFGGTADITNSSRIVRL